MTKTKEQIRSEIKVYIKAYGGVCADWYVGVASDPESRLFDDHGVSREGFWIYRECENSDVAREIEEYFINVVGTDGGSGGGDNTTKYVYAYKKTISTNE